MLHFLCGCRSPSQPHKINHSHQDTYTNQNNPYTQETNTGYIAPPLPAYTPHPSNLEKPPSQSPPDHIDEKNRLAFESVESVHNAEDVASDVSSAVSFTSSYGDTSTATRETPPPPYSPYSLSVSPVLGAGVQERDVNMVLVERPRPVFCRSGRSSSEGI
ncbi:hypothetical protein BDV25DRAFT_163647 [Aspergillus avenaceus]|uniref:Uncharacterized protein n=1 Tax=Aspergillus avenaceus TaxID=36643 RepID=A0A5N6THN1_ASPAV|nr:hypothetical protein BDV25DRAFT_163647 [Aspergillus avenaceus]